MPKSIVRAIGLIVCLFVPTGIGQAQPRNLNISWVDIAGGAATLMVSPSGESLLVDAGWEVGDRDAKQTAQTVHDERLAMKPGVEGVWQGHLSRLDKEHNAAENMIANLEDRADCQRHWIPASVAADGTYTITNSRNGFSSTFTARQSRAETPADPAFYAVSYVETIASAASEGIAALKQYRDASRTQDGFVRVDLFEQVGRPGHFAIVETWRDQKAFDVRSAAAQKALSDALTPIRVSDYDQRPYKTLTVGLAPPAANRRAIYVVTHVDVNQDPKVPALLRRLAEASRQEVGNLRFDVLQHTMRANHFTVVETWRDQQAFDAHVAAAHTRQYRDEVQPMTGSPLDERNYKAIE